MLQILIMLCTRIIFIIFTGPKNQKCITYRLRNDYYIKYIHIIDNFYFTAKSKVGSKILLV